MTNFVAVPTKPDFDRVSVTTKTYMVKLKGYDLATFILNILADYEDDLHEEAIKVYDLRPRNGDSIDVKLYLFQVDDYEGETTSYVVSTDEHYDEAPNIWTKHQRVSLYCEVEAEVFASIVTL